MRSFDDRFVVLGTGRSGTFWLTNALRNMGLKVGHEDVFNFNPTSGTAEKWADLDGDVALGAIGYPDLLPPTRPLVMRHPAKVATSFMAWRFWHDTCECHAPYAHLKAPYEQFLTRRVPEILHYKDPLQRSIIHQLRWIERGLELSTSNWIFRDLLENPEALHALATECGADVTAEEARLAGEAVGVVNLMNDIKQPQRDITTEEILRYPAGVKLMELWAYCSEQSAANVA